MKQILISDLHLDESREDLTQTFASFLDKECRDADELYILGDFFEVWLGDDDQRPFNRQIAAALKTLPGRLFIMHGNRDFLIGQDFCRTAGAELLSDPCTREVGGEPVLLMHGDSLCTRDTAYMAARLQLRSPEFQSDFLSKTLEERAEIATQIRGESKAHTGETEMAIMDVTPDEVVNVMKASGVNTLIHGHTHRPAVHDVPLGDQSGRRYVLGDWRPETHYLKAEHGQLSLLTYPVPAS
jgi:UDP-2,3-diacylglucosamine hydrolase